MGARFGHLDLLQWARESGCPMWGEKLCEEAALAGRWEFLKWAKTNGCKWDERTCANAACGGHLEMLKWLRASECPWDEKTCSFAASRGHLTLLKWARANGCPWDGMTCYWAAHKGHLEVLKWAVQNECDFNVKSHDVSDPKVWQWIKSKERPKPSMEKYNDPRKTSKEVHSAKMEEKSTSKCALMLLFQKCCNCERVRSAANHMWKILRK